MATLYPQPGVPGSGVDQGGQQVYGPQTNIAGDVYGPVLSGTFYGPVSVFAEAQYADLRRKLIDVKPILERVQLDRFVGREFVVAALDHFLETEPCGYFDLEGAPGIGKTTLLAHLVQQRGYLHHFVDRSLGVTRLDAALENLSAQVIAVRKLEWGQIGLPPEAGRDGAFLAARLEEAAPNLGPGQKLVVIVDALDEAERRPGANPLCLPPALPPGVYFVVSHRPGTVKLVPAAGTPRLPFTLSAGDARNRDDVRRFVAGQAARAGLAARLAQAAPAISPADFVDVMAGTRNGADTGRSEGNFVYLDYVLEAIVQDKIPALTLAGLPQGLEGYYQQFWDQLQALKKEDRDLWKTVYRPVIELLAVAQAPVTANWLVRLTGLDAEDVRDDALEQWLPFLAVQQVDGQPVYRLYHASFRDFLAARLGDLSPVHRRVAEAYLPAAPAGWQTCDEYGLRYVLAHLLAVARQGAVGDAEWARQALAATLGTAEFAQAHFDRVDRPKDLLAQMQAVVALLVEGCDLSRAWMAIGRYRAVYRQQRGTAHLFDALHKGRHEQALERSTLYAKQPGFQALLQLHIARQANQDGNPAVGQRAARAAVRQVSRLGSSASDWERAWFTQQGLLPALEEMLLRTARSVPASWAGPEEWLDSLDAGDEPLVAQVRARLSAPPPQPPPWRFDMDRLLDSYENDMLAGRLERAGEMTMAYRDQLADGLSQSWADPRWLEYVQRSVALLALDDYPAYREFALAVNALAVIRYPDLDEMTRKTAAGALETVLEAALEGTEPHFTGDLPAALVQARLQGRPVLPDAETMVNALALTPMDDMDGRTARAGGSVPIRARPDPWARSLLRYGAVAAVQQRLGQVPEARQTLMAAGTLDWHPNFAGYRALAHLGLACRWLEFRDEPAALAQIQAAHDAAGHMAEQPLRLQRQALVDQVATWLHEPDPDLEEIWRRLDDLREPHCGWYVQLLSARWMGDAERLRALVPRALEMPTALDAVLGRLVGTLASAGACLPELTTLADELSVPML